MDDLKRKLLYVGLILSMVLTSAKVHSSIHRRSIMDAFSRDFRISEKNISTGILGGMPDRQTANLTTRSDQSRRPRSYQSMWKKGKESLENAQEKSGEWSESNKEIREEFEIYYQCLAQRLQAALDLQAGKIVPVHALVVLEGETVRLGCLVCSRPDEDLKSQRPRWIVMRRSDSSISSAVSSKRTRVNEANSLVIVDVRLDDAGQYSCLDKGEYAAVYQLDVNMKERRRTVSLGEALLPDIFLFAHNLRIMTVWSPWSECDTCGARGQRRRTGECLITKLFPDESVKPIDYPFLALYPDGVPCRSTALPPVLRRLRAVRQRQEELIIGRCLEACSTDSPPVNVTDNSGIPVEVLGPPLIPPSKVPKPPVMVQQRVLYGDEGEHFLLYHTGKRGCAVGKGVEHYQKVVRKDDSIRWMRGQKRVDPAIVKRQSKGRVWIDSNYRLHFKKLQISDTAVYNCWDRRVHVAAVKLLVVSVMNEDLKDYISYAGIGLTIFACVFICAVFLRPKKKPNKLANAK